jgi:hypothetical protein
MDEWIQQLLVSIKNIGQSGFEMGDYPDTQRWFGL